MTLDELAKLADVALADPGAWWPVFSDALQEIPFLPTAAEANAVISRVVGRDAHVGDPLRWWIENMKAPTPTFARALAESIRSGELGKVPS